MSNSFKFTDHSEKVKKNLKQTLEAAMYSACLIVEASAKSNAKVGKRGSNGELRDTITHSVNLKDGKIVGQVGSPLMYAPYVEFGTGEFAENGNGRKGGWIYPTPEGKFFFTTGMKPSPFLRDAFRDNKKNIIDIFGKELKATFKGKGAVNE